jgi:hypothetical protein
MLGTKVAEKVMMMTEIRVKAKGLGINPGKMNKTELIHTVQVAEGYSPCYGKSNGQCPYTDCCFRTECLKIRS